MRFRFVSFFFITIFALTGCTFGQTQQTSFVPDLILAQSPVNSGLNIPGGDVLSLAQTTQDASYAEAVAKGAEIVPVDQNRSFVVWWAPENFDVTTGTVVVALHGHGSWATRDFTVWYPELTQRQYAYLGIQWWFGRSLESDGYYKPDMIYGLIRDELEKRGVQPGNVIFQGFSMGSANSYAVSAFDKWEGPGYFGVNIANSGPYESDFPPNAKIPTYAEKPFDGSHWILFCGEKDYNESGPHAGFFCDGMEATQTWLLSMGATVDLFIQDPTGDHGSFMMNKMNVNQALDLAATLLVQ